MKHPFVRAYACPGKTRQVTNFSPALIAALALGLASILPIVPPGNPFRIAEAQARPGAVKTFNLYLRNYYEPGDAQLLAKWDALGLDVDTPAATLNEIKSYNPNIKLLAYIPINGTYDNANIFPAGSKWRAVWEAAETNNWWLRNTQGGLIYDHPGKRTTNDTQFCPRNAQGQSYLEWFPQFIVGTVLQNGAAPWDGVILDDVWIGIWWVGANTTLNALPIDADRDGIGDDQPTLDALWKAGNDTLTARIRRAMPANEIVIGNGGNPFAKMNGAYIETFPYNGFPDPGSPLGYCWQDKMFNQYGYIWNEALYSNQPQRMDVVDAKWADGDRYAPVSSPDFERHKRFCMASALLGDGYFSLDHHGDDGAHDSLWWMPEYDKAIGTPTGAAYQANYGGTTLWRRDFTNGVVILNNTNATFTGSPAYGLPPIGWLDARVLLTSELWHSESVPPGAIADVAISRTWNNSVELQWTNVGDDGMSGQATGIEIRYSSAPINAGNWSQATLQPGVFVPELPGVSQKAIVTNLLSGQVWYFAIKTRDLSGNYGAISNVISGSTVVGDVVPPAAITDFTVVSTTSSTATIRWTSPGDDGTIGTATSFDIRYLAAPLSISNWANGAQVVGEPTPGPAGTVQTLTLYGMSPSTSYWIGIMSGDEMPNWSGLSNIPVATTLAGDSTPPSAINDLRIVGVTSNTLTLAWTAPGDDGLTGRANQYDLRWSKAPITPVNFDITNYITYEPGPAMAGTTQTLVITGLGVGYTYNFAMKTADEWPNWSTMSNVTTGTTNVIDSTAPAAVSTLTAAFNTLTSVTLNWTVTGDDGTTGKASSTDLRMSLAPITAANFAAATPIPWAPLPAVSGTNQVMVVNGLLTNTPYWFAVRIGDEVSNWSPLSNVVPFSTGGDVTPPATVGDLSIILTTPTTARINWTAPGDDGMAGRATSYELRAFVSPITPSNFSSCMNLAMPVPQTAGSTESYTWPGLTLGVTYYVAVVTRDEVGNAALLSNVPSVRTPATAAVPGQGGPGVVPGLRLVSENPVRDRARLELGILSGSPAGDEAMPAGPVDISVVDISIVDVTGRLRRQLFRGSLEAGTHSFEWDGRDESGVGVPNGVYFVRVDPPLPDDGAGPAARTLRLVLAR